MEKDYSNVPVFTGKQEVAQETTGFFQPATRAADGILATDQARAVAEVQAALVIAASRPRNELQARDRLMQACQRSSLAATALYQYSRGGTAISGPSIRLAETAARCWGNVTYGFRELSRDAGTSECEAFAWDLETNTKAVRQFSVKHWRDTREGGYAITDTRDIYEKIANDAQRRVRAAILEIIPGDIIEDAVAQCEATMKAKIGNVAEAAAKLVEVFAQFGVTREAIENRLGHRLDAIQPAQVENFRKIYTSIKDGMSEPKDWFDLPKEQDKPAPKPATKKRAAKSIEQEAPAHEPAPEQPQKPTGEEETLITCPNTGRGKPAWACNNCMDRDGCPAWPDEDEK